MEYLPGTYSPGQDNLQDTPDTTASCIRTQLHPPALGPLSSAARTWDPSLPTGGLTLVPGPGFTHWWAGTSPRISWTLTLPVSQHWLCPPLSTCWGFLARCLVILATSAKAKAWQPTRRGASQAYQTTCSSQPATTEGSQQPPEEEPLKHIALVTRGE